MLYLQIFNVRNYILFTISASGLFLKYSSNFANFSLDIYIIRERYMASPRQQIHFHSLFKCFPSVLHRRNHYTGHFGFCLRKTRSRKSAEITGLSWGHRFGEVQFSKCFPSTRKRKAGVFKFLWFEERFRKAPFSWRIKWGR